MKKKILGLLLTVSLILLISGVYAVICPDDMKTCPNGLSVSRNPANNCEFECSNTTTCVEGAVKKYTCPDGTQVDWCTCSYGNWMCVQFPETKCTTTSCVEGAVKKYTCPDGTQVDWCTCSYGNWMCVQSPELKCNTGEIKEQVKCLFAGSTQLQKCYTAEQNSRAYCSGTDACVADISGYKGERITWKSTCGGYAYTTIDGENEYDKFDCNNIGVCQPSKCDDGTMTECKIDNGQCICSTCPPIIIKPVCGNGICESGEGEICKATEIMCEIGKECKTTPAECFVACPQDCKITDGIYANLNEKFKLQVYQPVKIIDNGEHVLKITFRDLITSKCAETPISYEVSQTIASKVAVATSTIGTVAMTATG